MIKNISLESAKVKEVGMPQIKEKKKGGVDIGRIKRVDHFSRKHLKDNASLTPGGSVAPRVNIHLVSRCRIRASQLPPLVGSGMCCRTQHDKELVSYL